MAKKPTPGEELGEYFDKKEREHVNPNPSLLQRLSEPDWGYHQYGKDLQEEDKAKSKVSSGRHWEHR